jgi:hypothetical protein
MIHHPFFVDPSLSLRGDTLVRRAAETNLPVEPEALAELISRNRLAPQAHLDAIGDVCDLPLASASKFLRTRLPHDASYLVTQSIVRLLTSAHIIIV